MAFCQRGSSDKSLRDFFSKPYLKIAEVWLWENNRIRFFVYHDSGYLELTTSNSLPNLNSDRVTRIVNSCFGRSVLEVETFFP